MADARKANGRESAWPLKYFAVGNENWGCGGNMKPEFYADVYRRHESSASCERRRGDRSCRFRPD